MRTQIQTTVILQNSNKNGPYKVSVQLCKNKPNELTVKGRSHNCKDNRIFGTIHPSGVFVERKTKQAKGTDKLVMFKRKQIDTLLDLAFGTNRDKNPVFTKNGNVEFNK